MAEIKLFKINGESVKEQLQVKFKWEAHLQTLVEKNMKTMFGVTFLAHEYSIKGEYHDGRMDSIGIDENNYPVIFEYKKVENENVINQGLFYLDWLLNHKNDFYKLVLDKLGKKAAESIEWSNPRVLCIAPDFNKYDEGAINHMSQDVELIKWKRFEDDSLMFEYFKQSNKKNQSKSSVGDKDNISFASKLSNAPKQIKNLFEMVDAYIMGISDEVSFTDLKHYRAYKRLKNFAVILVEKGKLVVYLSLNPSNYEIKEGFLRDMTNYGHLGTGDLEITIKSVDDFEASKTLLNDAFNGN